MVERIWQWLNREWGGIHEAAFLLGLSALGSQILALARDRLLAASFGAGSQLDIYYAAFRLPDLIYVLLASFVSVTVLIPFIINRTDDGLAPVRDFLNSVFTVFFAVMIPVLVIVWFLVPILVGYIAPGFSPDARAELIPLVRLLLLSPLLLGLSNLFGAITQATRRFFIYALSPVLYNIGIIFGLLVFYPRWGLLGLGGGVILGAALHAAIQWPSIRHAGLWPRLTRAIDWPALRQVALVSLPRTLTLGAHQLALLVLVALGTYLGAGAVAVFNFAYNLQSVPLVIIGVSYSVAAFPVLAKLFSNGEHKELARQMSAALRHILFWSLPATVLFIVLRAQIVRVILGAGQFDWQDTRLTAAALALFVISLVGQALVLLFVRAYYACGLTRRPLLLNSLSSLAIILLAFGLLRFGHDSLILRQIFETLLRVSEVGQTGVLLLPLAFSLGIFLNLGLFWWFFQKDFGHFPKVVDRAVGQSVIGSLIAGLVSYQTLNWLAPLLDLNTFWGIFTQGLIAGLLGLAVLWLVLKYFGNKELTEIEESLGQKFWRSQPIAPEPEGL